MGAFVLTAIAATTTITVSNAEFAQRRSEAVKYVEEGIENVRIARDSADTWDEFLASSSGSEEDVPTGFTRRTTIAADPNSPGDINRRLVIVTVVWTDGKGEHQASSTTILTNWTQ